MLKILMTPDPYTLNHAKKNGVVSLRHLPISIPPSYHLRKYVDFSSISERNMSLTFALLIHALDPRIRGPETQES